MWGKTAVVTAAIALVGAAPAAATPEQEYLGALAGTPGFTVNAFTSVLLTNAGNASCTDLRAGLPAEAVAVRQLSFPGSTIALTRIMVSTAQQTLCPETAALAE